MNQLVFVEKNQAVTDSLTIAEVFGKDHNKVLRDINNTISKLNEQVEFEDGSIDNESTKINNEFSLSNFGQSTYINSRGQTYPKFNLSEEANCSNGLYGCKSDGDESEIHSGI